MKLSEEQLDYIVKSIIIFTLYFVSGKLGLRIDAVSHFATLVWLPTAISLVSLYFLGIKFWPAVAAAAFFVNLTTGALLSTALGISIGNSLEAIIGSYGLKKFNFNITLNSVRDVLLLTFIAAIFSTLVSATIGTTSLLLTKTIVSSSFVKTWVAWWIGDGISNLVIAPLVFVWINKTKILRDPKRLTEEFIFLGILTLLSFLVFSDYFAPDTRVNFKFLVFPPLTVIALRFSQRASISAVFILCTIAIISTLDKGINRPVSSELFILQTFIGVTAVTMMILAAASSERRNLERRKDEFLSIASHELRTPLTSMKILAQLTQRSIESKKYRSALPRVKKLNGQIDRLSRLVLELLDTSRIKEGKMKLEKERFSLYDLTKSIIEDFEVNKGNILVRSKVKIKVMADKDRIGQVILNLLSNALKHSAKDRKVVVAMVRGRRDVIFSVKNFGSSIPKEEQENIFDSFYQIHGASERKGMGLGLYISKEILKRHNGNIWVESKSGKNKETTFFFSIPIKG